MFSMGLNSRLAPTTVVQSFGYKHDRHLDMGSVIPKFGFLVVYAVWRMPNLRITCELE